MWTIFKVFIEFITILLQSYVLFFWPRGMCDLSSLIRIEISLLALESEVLTPGSLGKSLFTCFSSQLCQQQRGHQHSHTLSTNVKIRNSWSLGLDAWSEDPALL